MFKQNIPQNISVAILATALAVSPMSPAVAGGGDALVGGIIGGIIGGAIVNEGNKKHRTTRRVVVPSATRIHNREVQTSLNYFGFPAGRPDGVMGRNSRAAIAGYQAFLGYPATGALTRFESDFLLTSYNRAMAGGMATNQIVATNPLGTRGLLRQYQQEMAGATVMAVAPMTAPVMAPAPAPVTAPAVPAPVTTLAESPPASAALPNFMGRSETASLASNCNKVSLLTSTKGGFVTEATMTDPSFALNEQFCLARTYAIAQGEDLAAKVQGFTSAQIASQCDAFGPAMKAQIAALSLKPEAAVLQQVSSFVLQSGMSPAQLVGTAKICLSVGYRTDNMNVALASALLLTALGDPVYAELLGHHLSQGFGVSKRPDLALAWYQSSLDALAQGAQPVFAPGQPEREALIRKAAYQLGGGRNGAAAAPAGTTPQPAALPSFSVQE